MKLRKCRHWPTAPEVGKDRSPQWGAWLGGLSQLGCFCFNTLFWSQAIHCLCGWFTEWFIESLPEKFWISEDWINKTCGELVRSGSVMCMVTMLEQRKGSNIYRWNIQLLRRGKGYFQCDQKCWKERKEGSGKGKEEEEDDLLPRKEVEAVHLSYVPISPVGTAQKSQCACICVCACLKSGACPAHTLEPPIQKRKLAAVFLMLINYATL